MKRFALAGNPNSGKTTLFNALTGSTAHVGNWPGVTVDKKEGVYKKCAEPISIVDLPGIYSLSPYTPEEVISRNYILDEKPDCIQDFLVQSGDGLRAPDATGSGRGKEVDAVGMILPVLHQQVHRLLRDDHRADGVGSLGRSRYQFTILLDSSFSNLDGSPLHIQIRPEESNQFASAQAGGQFQIEDGEHTELLGLPQVIAYLVRRKNFHFLLFDFRDAAVVTRVVIDDAFIHCQLQSLP